MSSPRVHRWSLRIALLAWCLAAIVPGPGLRVCLPDTGGVHLGLGARGECPLHEAEDLAVRSAEQRHTAEPRRTAELHRLTDAARDSRTDRADHPHLAGHDDPAGCPACEDFTADGQRHQPGGGPTLEFGDGSTWCAIEWRDGATAGVRRSPGRARDGPPPTADDPALARRLAEQRTSVLLI